VPAKRAPPVPFLETDGDWSSYWLITVECPLARRVSSRLTLEINWKLAQFRDALVLVSLTTSLLAIVHFRAKECRWA